MLYHPEVDPLQFVAFRYALRHINTDSELLPGTQLWPLVVNITQRDSFSIGKRVCNAAREGVAAIFGPRAPSATGIVQSISENLEIPNLQTYSEVPEYPSRCLINLHPTQETISKVGFHRFLIIITMFQNLQDRQIVVPYSILDVKIYFQDVQWLTINF